MQDYDTLKEIGSGSFGRVCKIKRKCDEEKMACKEVNYRNLSEKEKGQIVSEVYTYACLYLFLLKCISYTPHQIYFL